jgi:hypothetical protein
MGSGKHGVRGRLTSVRAGVVRSGKGVRGGQRFGVPPLGDRVRGLPGHGKAGATRAPWKAAARTDASKQGRRRGLVPGWACACAGVHLGARASRPARSRARARTRPRHGVAVTSARHGIQRRHGTNELASERASMKAAAPARKYPSLARRPASPAAARRRRATARSTSARRPGHPHGEGSGCPHLGGHGPKCRRVGEERRGGSDGEEEDEAGGGAASRRKGKQRM